MTGRTLTKGTDLRLDHQPGIHDPIILMISRIAVEQNDLAQVLGQLRLLSATREDCWLYRGQLSIAFDGYDSDARELIDIPELRFFVTGLHAAWPHWAFFLNQLDHTINLWVACLCGDEFPGGGQAQIDVQKLRELLVHGFVGMSELFLKHHFPEENLRVQSEGLARIVGEIGPVE